MAIEITNKQTGPIQLVIRSGTKARAFTCLNIPGKGAGKNVYVLQDERMTDYILRAEQRGEITTRYVASNKTVTEGE